jgi:hypothetical protein
MTPAEILPELRPWVENLVNVWPAYIIKPHFASWQVLHIVSLALLGGCSILLNLRLIGVGLVEEAPSEMYRSLRHWITVGVVGIVVSGILIGMTNAERLYYSAAFTVKMVALLAGIILTYGASLPAARADGEMSTASKIWLLVGLGVWAFAMFIFITAELISPGVYHVLTAAALLVAFATRGLARRVYLAGVAALISTQILATHVVFDSMDFERVDPANITFAWLWAAWIAGSVAVPLFRAGPGGDGRGLTKLVGYFVILVWVSSAAAGRWIAFS